MKKFLIVILFMIGSACQAQVIQDTVVISDNDSTYTLYVLWHVADSVDTNHVIEFGYDHLGLGWITKMQMRDSAGVKIPAFIYMEDEQYRYDVNRDGKANIGDLVSMFKYIFGGL